jgi:hypothetical protein
MQTLIIMTTILVLAALSPLHARGGMHSAGASALMAPANPTVPPSLTPDPRLAGSAPLPQHNQPTKADVASLPSVMLTPTPEGESRRTHPTPSPLSDYR